MSDNSATRLKSLSRLMRWLCLALIAIVILVGVFTGITWFFERSALSQAYANTQFSPDTVSGAARIAVVLVNAVTLLFTCRGLLALSRLFGAFEKNEALSAHSSIYLRSAGFSFLIVAIYGIAAKTISILILTFGNPAGQRQLAVGLGSNELFAILLAGILFAVGHALAIAAEIAEENKGFV